MLDLQNGTNGRCRDSQRVLDELIEALEGYNEAVEGASVTRLGCGKLSIRGGREEKSQRGGRSAGDVLGRCLKSCQRGGKGST